MPSDRSILRTEINKKIVPILFEQGFVGKDLTGNSRDYDFVRDVGDKKHTFIFIFEKYGRGKFSIQLEIQVSKNEYIIGHPYREAFFGKKFEFTTVPTFIERLRSVSSARKAELEIDMLTNLMREIEEWWINPTENLGIQTYHEKFNKT